ncbi:MAG: MFS transporter, partial [Chloroflexi bacterium]|nr:MFS transporter [Chloroflexota bacterium]
MTGRPGGEDARVRGPDVLGVPYPWLALSLVCLGVLLANIDTSIITIALPTLAQEFGVARDEVLWVSLIYILVGTGLSPIIGRLGDLYGRKRLYVVGFACFTIATGLSAIAGSLPELLAARMAQAVAVATVIANGAAIVTDTFPAARRGRALGIMISMVGV